MKKPVLIGIAAGWVATLAAAWWLGQQAGIKREQLRATQQQVTSTLPPPPAPLNRARTPAKGEDAGGPSVAAGSVEDIFKQLMLISRSGSAQSPTTAFKMVQLASQIREEDIPKALELVEDLPVTQMKMGFYIMLLSRWAEKDAPAALVYAEEKFQGQDMIGRVAKAAIVSAWAEKDADAAWEYFEKSVGKEADSPLGERGMMLGGLFANMAGTDIEKAFARLSSLDSEVERRMALSGITQSAINPEMRDKLMEKIGELEDPKERQEGYQMLLGQLALLEPNAAKEKIDQLPEEMRGEVAQQVGSTLMMNDPKKGAGYILQYADPNKKPEAYERVINQWGYMDINAAGEWLLSQPQGPELDRARAAFSRIASERDPESAMEWAKTVETAGTREKAIEHVYSKWRLKDDAAANAALEQSGLPAEKVQSLRGGQ